MREGTVIAAGEPADVITTENLKNAFGLDARIVADPVAGSPMVVPIGRFHGAPVTDAP
jgi:iron complex transport system ATP-binding protein